MANSSHSSSTKLSGHSAETNPASSMPKSAPESGSLSNSSRDSDTAVVINPITDSSYTQILLPEETTDKLFAFPLLTSDSLLLSQELLPTLEYFKFKSLPKYDKKWVQWVTRLKKFDSKTWRKQGLYQLIQMSTIDINFQLELIEGALRLWAPSCNSFIFPCGPMSITLQDILKFTGLPVLGTEFASLVNAKDTPELSESYLNPSSYATLIKRWHKSRVSPTSDERISFMWVLICKYIFCPASGRPTIEYLSLARSLSVGQIHGLGVMFLGSIYRWLNKSVSDLPLSKLNGVVWLLQLWLFSYFPELRNPSSQNIEPFDWRGLMSCRSGFNATGTFSFLSSLPFERSTQFDPRISLNVHLYPWIEYFINLEQKDLSFIIGKIQTALVHQRFLVPEGTFLHENGSHAFVFYNPSLYPYQLGFCPQVPSNTLYLPHTLTDAIRHEMANQRFTYSTLKTLSELARLFKYPGIKIPIIGTDGYYHWWRSRYNSLFPKTSDTAGQQLNKRHKLDFPVTVKKEKNGRKPASVVKKEKKEKEPITSPPLESGKPPVDESGNPPPQQNVPDSLLSHSLLHDKGSFMFHSPPQDLSMRRAMVSFAEDEINFDFSFIDASSSTQPSETELATAKASLRHFLGMNLATLGDMEKSTMLSAVSALKASSAFSKSPLFEAFATLPSMFSTFQDTNTTCAEMLTYLGGFISKKDRLDGMIAQRKTVFTDLLQKIHDFDSKVELVRKLETELAQHKADMIGLLEESESMKAFSVKLKQDIQQLGEELMSQKESYQKWEEILGKAKQARADCCAKWEELGRLDLG